MTRLTVPPISLESVLSDPPPELWEIVGQFYREWFGRHSGVARFLFRLSRFSQRTALVLLLLALIFVPRLGIALVPAFSMLCTLAVMVLLARTRTVRWRSLTLLMSVSTVWAFAVAWLTTVVASLAGLDVFDHGMGIALAAFVEEPGKLLPLLLIAVVAPGRARRFSASDWVLLGYASGAGFTVAEDGVRRLVPPGWLAQILGEDRLSYSLNPWTCASFTTYGEGWWEAWRHGYLVGASVVGHQVSTMTVAAGVGLGVAVWRACYERQLLVRTVCAVLPASLMLLLVTADHAAYNATVASASWLSDGEGFPFFLRLVWFAGNAGRFQPVLSVLLFGVCLLVDAERRLSAGAIGLTTAQAPAVWVSELRTVPSFVRGVVRSAMALVSFAVSDLVVILAAYTHPGIERSVRMVQGRSMGWHTLQVRADAMRVTTPGREPQGRRRFRLSALLLGVIVGIACVGFGVVVARNIGGSLSVAGDGLFFAGLLDNFASWWESLSFAQQVLLIAAGVMLLTAAGASLGLAFGVVGVGTWAFTHGHGLASFVRDPRAATSSYIRNVTPGQLLWDLLDFGLTFIPGSILGAAGRAVFRIPLGSLEMSLGLRAAAESAARRAARVGEVIAEQERLAGLTGRLSAQRAVILDRQVAARQAAQQSRRALQQQAAGLEQLRELFAQRASLQAQRAAVEAQLQDLLPEGFGLSDLTKARYEETLKKVLKFDISEQEHEFLIEAANRRRQILASQSRLGEYIGERGGEQALENAGYELVPAFHSTSVNSPGIGANRVDGVALSPAVGGQAPAEMVIAEYKGGGASLSSRPVATRFEGAASQVTPAYVRDHLISDDRVIQLFHDNPALWESVKHGRTRLSIHVYYTRTASALPHPDVTPFSLTPQTISAIEERLATLP